MTGLISTGEKVRIDELGESRRRRQCSAVTEHRNASGRGGLYQIPGWDPEVCISKEFQAAGLEACFRSGKGWSTDF